MSMKQISVFVENRAGNLAEVTELLAAENINLRALSIADTSEFGILRLIVSEPDKAASLLLEKGFTYTVTDVLAVVMRDEAGGLSEILKVLAAANIDLEYAYAFVSQKEGQAYLVIRVADNEVATAVLQQAGIQVVGNEIL